MVTRTLAATAVGIGTVTAMALAATPAAAAATAQGSFSIHFPKGQPFAPNPACTSDPFCGVGSLAGYGAATISILDETFDQIGGSDCLAITRTEQIDLVSDSSSLTLNSVGTFCRPGGSGNSNGGAGNGGPAYGNPGTFSLVATVDPTLGTGVFAGVSGGGTEVSVTAGGVATWHLSLALSS